MDFWDVWILGLSIIYSFQLLSGRSRISFIEDSLHRGLMNLFRIHLGNLPIFLSISMSPTKFPTQGTSDSSLSNNRAGIMIYSVKLCKQNIKIFQYEIGLQEFQYHLKTVFSGISCSINRVCSLIWVFLFSDSSHIHLKTVPSAQILNKRWWYLYLWKFFSVFQIFWLLDFQIYALVFIWRLRCA